MFSDVLGCSRLFSVVLCCCKSINSSGKGLFKVNTQSDLGDSRRAPALALGLAFGGVLRFAMGSNSK